MSDDESELLDERSDANEQADELELDEVDEFDADAVTPPERRKPRGTYIGAAMLGLQQAMFGKVKEETVIEVEASGDPPNIDLDGLDTPFVAGSRLVGPPLDQIKSRARRRRRTR